MYIFRPPARSYDVKFTFEGLQDYINRGRSGSFRMLGTTLELRTGFSNETEEPVSVVLRLYQTDIAYIRKGGIVEVMETVNFHGSQATTYWLQKAISDNGAPGLVGRENGKYRQAGMKWNGKFWEERYPGAVRRANR